jgi:hypothetical protein
LRVGQEVWLYYGGANYTHGTPCIYRAEGTGRKIKYTGSIGLAIWDVDRFVSVNAPPEGGTLTTIPITFSGSRLEINAKTDPGGSIVVHLLDAAGNAIDGYGKSDTIEGDSPGHVATWGGNQDVEAIGERPIVLRFEMKKAKLFAFAFRRN